MKLYVYHCIVKVDNGWNVFRKMETIVSKDLITAERVRNELYKLPPYNEYDTFIKELIVDGPIVLPPNEEMKVL